MSAQSVELVLRGGLEEVPRSRAFVRQAMRARLGALADDAELVVTELVTNAVRHGGPGVDLWVRRLSAGGLRLEVVDGRSGAPPTVQRPDDDAEGGRGLLIVQALARRWGTERLAAGKQVWCELGPA